MKLLTLDVSKVVELELLLCVRQKEVLTMIYCLILKTLSRRDVGDRSHLPQSIIILLIHLWYELNVCLKVLHRVKKCVVIIS